MKIPVPAPWKNLPTASTAEKENMFEYLGEADGDGEFTSSSTS